MSNETNQMPAYLDPSPLGTKEYWDALYTRDISMQRTVPSHAGQTWFDDNGAEEKTLQYLEDEAEVFGLRKERTSFLDLGTGNGRMLVALRDEGWTGGRDGLWGCDYSKESVEFARTVTAMEVADEEGAEGKDPNQEGNARNDLPRINLLQHDIFAPTPMEFPSAGFDVVLDKGTFDAISLSDQLLPSGRRMCEGYVDSVLPLVKKEGGLLLITSCNWTESELRRWIESTEAHISLRMVGRVKYPSFNFGGKEGSTLVGLCWRRI